MRNNFSPKVRFCILTALFFLFSAGIYAQNVLSVPFSYGFIGVQGNNSQHAENIQTYATLGLEQSFFIQNSSDTIFQLQGNDIAGTLRLISSTGNYLDVDGAIVWRITSGSVLHFFGFIPSNSSPSINLTTIGGSDYVIDSLSNYAMRINSDTTTVVDSTNINGNAATNGLLDALNDYLTEAGNNAPSGPLTADDQTTTNTSPTITGTVTLGAGETFSVTIDGVEYDTSSGVTISGTDWSLTIPYTMAIDTFPITASISNAAGYVLQDNATLIILQPSNSPCTDPDVPTLSGPISNTICPGDPFTIGISGNLNDATKWYIYSGSCGGTLIDSTASTSFTIAPNNTTTYYVRGEGGCASGGTCGSYTVVVESPDFNYSGDTLFCIAGVDPVPTITGVSGGVFSSTAGLDIDSSTGIIDLSNSTVGSYSINYDPPAFSQLGVDIDGEVADDRSGNTVALSSNGDVVAIGSRYNDDGGVDAGHVRVYEWDGTTWNQKGGDIDGEAAGDQLSFSLDISGDGSILVVGAFTNDGNGANSGHARVYEFDGTSWNQLGSDLDGEAAGDQNGWSVAINNSGDRVAIGARSNDGSASNAGHVRVYDWDGTSWNQVGADIDGEAENDYSGWSLSMSSNGNRIAIGAPLNDGNGGSSGHVRVYEWDGTTWNQLGLDIDGEASGDQSGAFLDLSKDGTRVAIGGYQNDGGGAEAGHVRVYEWDGTTWNQIGADIDGEAAGDQSGVSLALSQNGSTIVIGAVGSDANGTNSGHVRVYDWDGSAWVQLGSDIDGEAAGDNSGRSVSISNDGTKVAVGAQGNDGNGNGSGHVRIYSETISCETPLAITISNLDDASFSYSDTLFCESSADISPTITGESGGTFSSSPAGLTIDSNTGVVTITSSTPGSYVITYTTGGDCSNSSIFSITIFDDVDNPTALCQNVTVQLDASGNASITASDIDNGSSDNCGVSSLSVAPSTFDCSSIGSNTVTLTVNDENGNSSSCTATVTVEDNSGPTAICQDVTLSLDDMGQATLTAAQIDGGSTDNCSSFTLSIATADENWDCSAIGPNTVTLTITDSGNNSATCEATVTVEDNIAPTFDCPNFTPGTALTFTDPTGDGTFNISDNTTASLTVNPNTYGTLGWYHSGGLLMFGTSSGDYSGGPTVDGLFNIDAAGNFSTPMTFNTGDVIDNSTGTTGWGIISNLPVGSYNVGFKTSSNHFGYMNLTFDGSSIVLNNVYVNPTAGSGITIGGGGSNSYTTSQDGNLGDCVYTVSGTELDPTTLADNCVTTTLTNDFNNSNTLAGANLPVGTTDIVWTITDSSGNSTTCTIQITVTDDEPPVAVCPANITVDNDPGLCNANVTFTLPTPTENCGHTSTSDIASGSTFPLGSTTVTVTTTDNAGQSDNCTFTVTVNDVEDPVALCPADISVDTDSGVCTADVNFTIPAPTDNCGASSIADITSGSTFDLGATTVTVTATDAANNTNTCTFTVTVSDNEAPAVVTQNITVYLDASGNASIADADLDNGSTDNCAIVSYTASQTTYGIADLGSNNETLTVEDASSNTNTAPAVVTVLDTIPPSAFCQDVTLTLDGNGNASLSAAQIDGGSTDATGIASLSIATANQSWDCSQVGTHTVTLTVTDNSGNISTCDATLTIVDDAPPVAITQNITVYLDASGNATIADTDIDNGSTDNCGIVSYTASQTTYGIADIGTNNETLTVADASSNTDTAPAIVTVLDTIPPNAVCQDVTLTLDANGMVTLNAAQIDGGSTDAGGIASLSITLADGEWDCSEAGTHTVTLTVTDNSGNVSTCDATVTIIDNIPPTAVTQDINVYLDATGNATITDTDLDNGSFDNCGIVSYTASQVTFGVADIGPNDETLTVADASSNTDTAPAMVMVLDTIPPNAVCQDVTLVLDANGNATLTAADIDGGSTDAAGIASLSIDMANENWDCSQIGPNTVTLTVTDNSGNTATCDAIVTVVDNMAPTAICQDLTVSLDANGEFVLTSDMVDDGSTDNCAIASLALDPDDVNWDCNEIGAHVVTMTVTDGSGNSSVCTANLTVVDDSIPTAVCNDLTVSINSSGFYQLDPEIVGAGSSDNCGESALTYSLDEDIMLCEQAGSVVTVTLTVTDAAGNSSTCEAEITVEDNIPPTVLECMHDLTLTTDPGLCTANSPFEDWTYIYTDNCLAEGITVTDDNPYNYDFPVGTTTVTLTFTDNAGNEATCSFDITVTDDEAPDAVCQDITVQLDDTGNATITAADIDGGSTDNCGIASLEIAAADQDWTCAEVGDNTVTLTVTDVNGNVSTCDATVTVEDNVPPVAVCQDITIQLDADGNATITAADIDGGSNDACGIASVEIDAADEDWTCADVGDNTVTLTVTDVNGNVSTCDATVTVEDNIAPDAVCQDITVQLDDTGNATITAADIDGGSTDNCGIASIEIDAADEDWTCADVGDNTVTLTVTDVNGNSSTCDATVTVEDNVAPDAVCQDITIELDENGEASIVAADIDGGSTDACGIASIEIDAADEDWTCAEVGDNTVTLTVTDVNGNSSTCDATVTVEDNIAPTVVCPDIEINLDPGLCGAVVDYDVESTDNCGIASEVTVAGPVSGDYLDYHDGPWTVTMDVTDVNGNVSTCDFTITMNEFANPTETLACNDHVYIALDEDGCSTVGADMILEGGPYGCYDDYIVTVENGTAEVCCDEIGDILTVVVTDPDTGNTCEGTIEAFDNLAPTCVSIADYTIACEAELPSGDDTGHPGYPVFEDNCGLDLVYLSVETILDGDICTDPGMQIERVWYAVDESGNVVADADACVQTITIERTPLTFPGDQTYDCAQYELADLVPALTGEPTPASAAACMYNATYSDQVLPTCGGLSKVIRTWTVMDWCTGEVITTDGNGGTNVQELKLMDGEGPSIDATDIVVGTDTDQCGFTGFIPAPSITDNCTGVASVQMFITGLPALELVYDAAGNVVGGLVGEPGLSLGSDEVLIVATDNCGNFTEETVTITVEDQTEPLPICDEITQVALTTDGTAEVFAETFDDGSYDNCCLDGFDVTRMDDGTFGPSVLFDCADVNTSVQVIFRAHDCHGNSNVCMVEVLVEDKINPYLGVPANTEISCDVYYADLAAELDAGNGAVLETMFGAATYGDNCEAILDYSYTYSVDECGVGSITRSWTVTDPSGNGPVSGTQTIGIYHVSDWTISFPGDIMADCVDGQLPDFGEPVVSGDNCENIAISYTDTQYDVVPDACFKIVREWTAINWCTYPDETAQTAIQVMKVVDTEAPIFNVEDMTVEITESDCDTPVTLPTPDVTDCSDDITITTTSDLPAGEAGPGTYTASYVVTDGCGNVSYDQITITVVDAKKPTPYLTDELVTEIMQTGMTLTVEAEDFDIGSFDNCSDVTLSFSPDVTDTERVFDCSQLGPNTLEVWVTDAAGNQDFATVTLTVQDNMGVCGPGTLTIAGALTTEGGEGIEDATVEINGGLFNHTTDETGTYSFDLEAGADYSVVPSLDLDAGNGVTTFDMVLITQHILGMNTFTNPYQLIAADANNSNTITTLDLVAIRMVILQMTDAFPNNTSWRFVDADHVFADPTDPWGYPEVINYNNLDVEDLAADFIGVKIGDVNGTAQANFQSPAENRTNKNIQINTTDEQVQAGQEVTLHFTSAAAVSGYQFTLNHEGLELVSIQEGLARTEHFGVHAGALTASWNDMEIRNLAGEDLFSVTFKATESVQLSEVLTINSRYTQAEAYTTQGIEGVELTFSGQANTDYVLYQNVPNPFNGQTTIGFDLAKAGPASLTIMTIDGQTVKSINGDFAAGYNEVIIKDLNAVGVLYYSLESGDFTATKKMIVIE